jgi:hypothetical protein
MEVTGQNFDMDPKTFTLGNMFSMQLHKYAEEIGKITNAAVKVGICSWLPGLTYRLNKGFLNVPMKQLSGSKEPTRCIKLAA